MTLSRALYALTALCYLAALISNLTTSPGDDAVGLVCLIAGLVLTIAPFMIAMSLPIVSGLLILAGLFLATFVALSFKTLVAGLMAVWPLYAVNHEVALVACAALVSFLLLVTDKRQVRPVATSNR